MISPGIIGLYWLLAAFAAATLHHTAKTTVQRLAHRAGRGACPCGGRHQ